MAEFFCGLPAKRKGNTDLPGVSLKVLFGLNTKLVKVGAEKVCGSKYHHPKGISLSCLEKPLSIGIIAFLIIGDVFIQQPTEGENKFC